MGFLLIACFFAELTGGGTAIFDMAKGSGRKTRNLLSTLL